MENQILDAMTKMREMVTEEFNKIHEAIEMNKWIPDIEEGLMNLKEATAEAIEEISKKFYERQVKIKNLKDMLTCMNELGEEKKVEWVSLEISKQMCEVELGIKGLLKNIVTCMNELEKKLREKKELEDLGSSTVHRIEKLNLG